MIGKEWDGTLNQVDKMLCDGDDPDDRIFDTWAKAAQAFENAVPPNIDGFIEWQARMRAAIKVLNEEL